MEGLLKEVLACEICSQHLPLGPRPVLRLSPSVRIIIIGQAPGKRVHESGIPWDDSSGIRLRDWMGLSPEEFYDEAIIGILPMGFCYPGKGKSGDLPPRRECAPAWHQTLLAALEDVRLTLLVGSYAQNYYLPSTRDLTLTERVKHYSDFLPTHFPLPHPSPRNNIWMKKNPWFEKSVLPDLRRAVQAALTVDAANLLH